MMAAFATPGELASWLQVATVDTATANLQLNIASDAIRTWCGWSITQETDAEMEVEVGDYDRHRIWLPTRRLTAVSEVVDDETALTDDQYRFTRNGALIRTDNKCWTHRKVTATVTHGYDTVPDAVKGVCLAIAGRGYQNPVGATSATDSAGPFTRTQSFGASSNRSMFEPDEIKALTKFRLQAIA
jgi:hypothetical protein